MAGLFCIDIQRKKTCRTGKVIIQTQLPFLSHADRKRAFIDAVNFYLHGMRPRQVSLGLGEVVGEVGADTAGRQNIGIKIHTGRRYRLGGQRQSPQYGGAKRLITQRELNHQNIPVLLARQGSGKALNFNPVAAGRIELNGVIGAINRGVGLHRHGLSRQDKRLVDQTFRMRRQ